MTVKELYEKISERMPEELRLEWDNDGIMCCTDSSATVSRVLVSLDVTDEVIDYAIRDNFDLIVSHHPLIFKPTCLRAIMHTEPPDVGIQAFKSNARLRPSRP